MESLTAAIEELPLTDHHVHTVLPGPLTRPEFEAFITESDAPAPAGTTSFDSQLGFAIRRWCSPVLGLEPAAATADAYVLHRNRRPQEAAAAMLRAAGCGRLLVDTGFIAPGSLGLDELGSLSGAAVSEVVRLETVAAELAGTGCPAAEFARRYRELLGVRSAEAVGLKSIMAYRYGLDFDPRPPSPREVTEAAGRWLREIETSGVIRLSDPVLLREVLWAGVERGLPIQFHTGFGDPELDLRRSDPLLLRGFLDATATAGVPVMLLHCYPFHRHAAFLAQAYPHVYLDLGMVVTYTGARVAAVLAETLELAPFAKVLYSSDAYGLPELVYLGARLWRKAVAEVFGDWIARGEWQEQDAVRVAGLMSAGNAARVYQFPGASI
jgi:uncharacterized protein